MLLELRVRGRWEGRYGEGRVEAPVPFPVASASDGVRFQPLGFFDAPVVNLDLLAPRDLIQVARRPIEAEVVSGVEVARFDCLRDPSAEVLEDRPGEDRAQRLGQVTPILAAYQRGLGRAVHVLDRPPDTDLFNQFEDAPFPQHFEGVGRYLQRHPRLPGVFAGRVEALERHRDDLRFERIAGDDREVLARDQARCPFPRLLRGALVRGVFPFRLGPAFRIGLPTAPSRSFALPFAALALALASHLSSPIFLFGIERFVFWNASGLEASSSKARSAVILGRIRHSDLIAQNISSILAPSR